MNVGICVYTLGTVLLIEGAVMVPSALICMFCGEYSAFYAFLAAILISVAGGILLTRKKPKEKTIYLKEGLSIAALSWMLISAVGALPFYWSGAIPSYLDSLFETVSGFTTTGASILKDVEIVPRGLLFWRSFTHWIGGMGVLVFLLAIVPFAGGASLNIMRAESPGPSTSKFVPKSRQSARILYGIYIVMTAVEVVLLMLGGMPLFDSLLNSFGTAGTGGFSIKNQSIAAYNSSYIEYVIGIFMILFGVNFNIYFWFLTKKHREAGRDEELRTYLIIIAASVLIIVLNINRSVYSSLGESFRYAFFQVASIITTTGYATADFDRWPQLSRMILLGLMFCGACAGSTGGGIKVSRIVLAFKASRAEMKKMIHPKIVNTVHMDGKPVDKGTISVVYAFLAVYAAIFVVSVLLVALDGETFDTTFSAVASCFNNIGPGLDVVGPKGNYSQFSALSKVVLTLDMLLGRLEIFPLLTLFSPGLWKKPMRTVDVSRPSDGWMALRDQSSQG